MNPSSLTPSRVARAVALAVAVTLSGSALAANYFVVVPVKGRAAAPQAISVSLNAASLPAASVGEAYAGFDFNTTLTVTGDSKFDSKSVTWQVVDGTLPAGLTLGSTGHLAGTPTAVGPASFSVRATYRTNSGQQAYQVVVSQLTVALAARQQLVAAVGSAVSVDFKPLLSVTGVPSYDASKVTWTTVGALPTGLALSSAGVLSGTPALNDAGATFQLQASYGGKSGQQTYSVVPSDPSYGNVGLLMHMDGANGSTSFTDAKGHAFTASGAASISTASSKYGGASAWFNSGYLQTNYSSDYVFPGDFTVELWANISAHGTYAGLISAAAGTSWNGWQIIFDQTTNNLRVESSGQNAIVSSTPLPLNSWAHVALVRQGMGTNNVRLYINGAQTAAMTYTGSFDSGGAAVYLGTDRTTTNRITGYLDDVRVTKGVARYSGSFTPPAVSHPTR
jgi:hypothetical protein